MTTSAIFTPSDSDEVGAPGSNTEGQLPSLGSDNPITTREKRKQANGPRVLHSILKVLECHDRGARGTGGVQPPLREWVKTNEYTGLHLFIS